MVFSLNPNPNPIHNRNPDLEYDSESTDSERRILNQAQTVELETQVRYYERSILSLSVVLTLPFLS